MPTDPLSHPSRDGQSFRNSPQTLTTSRPAGRTASDSLQIAVYGKGGIGKSTISANLSAALARQGQAVLQVGCDPKHDSTRLLLGGGKTVTALDYLRQTPVAEQCAAHLLRRGYAAVDCIEAGGPEPGVGCAGRGILSMFTLLDRVGVDRKQYDTVLFDVLGDVVCGGFAVPLRQEYANTVLLVTSEEFMPIYAANNILRGICNFDGAGARIAGLILNLRERTPQRGAIERFAEATRLPILATLPRSDLIGQAEQLGQTVIEAFPASLEARIFTELAQQLLTAIDLHPAAPLTEDALEALVRSRGASVLNHAVPPSSAPNPSTFPNPAQATPADATLAQPKSQRYIRTKLPMLTPYYYRKPPLRPPVQGCAYTGAVMLTTQIQDAVTVVHGPRSCAHMDRHYLYSSAQRTLTRYQRALPEKLAPALVSTDLDENAMIYGGGDRLRDTLQQVLAARPSVAFVVTTCPAGLIGDDIVLAIAQAQPVSPRTRIIALEVDGNLNGGYQEGWLDACQKGAAALIDPACPVGVNDAVNLVGETAYGPTEDHVQQLTALLHALDIQVNTRFVQRASVESLRKFKQAQLNLLAHDGFANRQLAAFLRERFGAVFAAHTFPIGFHQTCRWLTEIAQYFGRGTAAERLIESLRHEYQDGIQALRDMLCGKRIMLVVTHNPDVDWILETAFDCGMEVVQLAIMRLPEESAFQTRYRERLPLCFGYRPEQQVEDIARLRPDLVLSGFSRQAPLTAARYDTFPPTPQLGPTANFELAQRWRRLLRAPLLEGWRQDAANLL